MSAGAPTPVPGSAPGGENSPAEAPAPRFQSAPRLLAGARPSPDGAGEADAPVEIAPARSATARWLAVAASLVVAAIAAAVLWHLLSGLDAAKVRAALVGTPGGQLALAGACTGLSYALLTGYDALALRHFGRPLPFLVTAAGSFASFAVSFTLGFPLVTAAAVRYAVYAPRGLSAGYVARLTIIAGFTFWLGMGAVLGIALLGEGRAVVSEVGAALPQAMRESWAAPLLGTGLIAGIAAYIGLVAARRPTLVLRGWRLKLPGPKTTLMQLALGAADVAAAAGVLYVLLPEGHGVSYGSFVAIYVVAAALGVASHVPGGAGAFEAVIILALNDLPREALVGSLLLYRLVYYLVPFLLALALLAVLETTRRAGPARAPRGPAEGS